MAGTLTGGASLRTPMSFPEFVALGETKHHEYYDGLCVVNPPTNRHAMAVAALTVLLGGACPESLRVLVGGGWQVGPDRVFEPDLMVLDERRIGADLRHEPPPVLVVEVLSPSTRDVDWGVKRADYGRGGAAWYWLVDLDAPSLTVLEGRDGQLVEVQRISGTGTTRGPFPVVVDPVALTA